MESTLPKSGKGGSKEKQQDDIEPGDDKVMSCTGIAYYSKAMKDAKIAPVCFGIKRTLPTKLPSENMTALDKIQKKNVIHSVCMGYSQCSGRMERLGNAPVCLKGVPITVTAVPEAPRSSLSSHDMPSSSSLSSRSSWESSITDSKSSTDSSQKQQDISKKLSELKTAVAVIDEERRRIHAEYVQKAEATKDPKELGRLRAEYLSRLEESQMKMRRVQDAVNRITDDYNRQLIQQDRLKGQMQQQSRSSNTDEGSKEFKVVLSTDALYKFLNRTQKNIENGEMKQTIEDYANFTTKACKKQYERLEKYYQSHGKELPGRFYESGRKIINNMPKTIEKVGEIVSKFIDDISRK